MQVSVQNILLVGLGGFVGSVLRYLASGWLPLLFKSTELPLGTMFVNIVGSLLIGFLGGFSDHIQVFSPNFRLLVFVGLLGGFTTFSTFGYETISLIRNEQFLLAFANVSIQLFVGFSAVIIGYYLSKLF